MDLCELGNKKLKNIYKVEGLYITHPVMVQEFGEEIFAISFYVCETKNGDISEAHRGENAIPIFKRHKQQ